MRRALRRRTAVVVFAPVVRKGAASATMEPLPWNVLSVQRARRQCFCNYYRWEDDTNFWPIGFGFGFDATRGTRLLRAGFPAQVLCMACSRKMVRGCCSERRCPRSPQPYELIAPAFSTSGTTWAIVHCPRRCLLIALRATRVGAHSRLGLPLAAVSKQSREGAR